MHEGHAERAGERERARLHLALRARVVIGARLKPPAAASGVEVQEGVAVRDQVLDDRRSDPLGRVAARVSGIHLVQIGAPVLLGREPPERSGGERIGDRDDRDPPLESRGVEPREKAPDRDRRQELVAVGARDDAESRTCRAAGDDVQRQREQRPVQHRGDLDAREPAAFRPSGPQRCTGGHLTRPGSSPPGSPCPTSRSRCGCRRRTPAENSRRRPRRARRSAAGCRAAP